MSGPRVLQLGRFWNDAHGGIERHAALLCRGLAERGAEVVNLVAAQGREPDDRAVDGYRLVQAPSYGMFARTAVSPGLVARAMAMHRRRPFDVVHLHFPDPLSHLVSMTLGAGPRRVITWHSDIVRQKRLLRFYGPFLRREVMRADALVAATQAHFDSSVLIPQAYPAERRHVIPYGLDYANLRLTPEAAAARDGLLQLAAGRPLVFALGRHVYYKGFDVLLRAVARVPALFLVLGGSGPLNAELRALAAALGIGDRVHFSGRIPEDRLASYFRACDIFCLPSVEKTEAFGLVQLEAMACGKPVVCTRLGTGVNVVNEEGVTGLAADPGDPVSLAGALGRLAASPGLRETLGERGKERAYSLYSFDAMSDRTLSLYRQLLG